MNRNRQVDNFLTTNNEDSDDCIDLSALQVEQLDTISKSSSHKQLQLNFDSDRCNNRESKHKSSNKCEKGLEIMATFGDQLRESNNSHVDSTTDIVHTDISSK